MKKRIGFVSNSSSSSFCIYGTYISHEKLKETLVAEGIMSDPCGDIESWFWGIEGADFLKKHSLSAQNPEYHEGTYLGRSWKDIPDDQTGATFKEEVEKTITETLGEEVECSTHEVAWEDR